MEHRSYTCDICKQPISGNRNDIFVVEIVSTGSVASKVSKDLCLGCANPISQVMKSLNLKGSPKLIRGFTVQMKT